MKMSLEKLNLEMKKQGKNIVVYVLYCFRGVFLQKPEIRKHFSELTSIAEDLFLGKNSEVIR